MTKHCGTTLKNLIGDEEVKKLYLDKDLSIKQIAEQYNCDDSSISKYLHRLGIKLKPRKHIYYTNNEYFSIPNIQNSYWAGYIAADGCITERDHGVVLCCKRDDRIILETIKKHTNCEVPILDEEKINFNKLKQYSRLTIYSQQIVDDLLKYWNITPRKTLTLQPPKYYMKNDLALAFIIGYIDGDGCIRYAPDKKYNTKYLEISMAGTKEVLEWIAKIISNITNNQHTVSKIKKKNCHILKIHCKYAELLKDQLKQIPLDFKLSRKWDI